MNKKSLLIGLLCYIIWGVLPLYWHGLAGVNSVFILCNRIVWSAVFCLIILAAKKSLGQVKAVFTDKELLKFVVPASVFITLNWGIYIWAVGSGHVLDSSFGYFFEPLVVSLFGIVIFREKCTKLQLCAFALAFIGVVYYGIKLGRLPLVSVGLALTFAIYGALKKRVHMEPIVGIAVETLIISPFALVYIIYKLTVGGAGMELTTVHWVLLLLAGVATASPMMLFAKGVNDLPLVIMGFLQYVSPTLQMLTGLYLGEDLTKDQLFCFVLIWIGFILFTISLTKTAKEQSKE